MVIYLVAINKGHQRHDYSAMFDELRTFGRTLHLFRDVWLVSTEQLPSTVGECLNRFLVKDGYIDDYILVAKFRPDYSGVLPKYAEEWWETERIAGTLRWD